MTAADHHVAGLYVVKKLAEGHKALHVIACYAIAYVLDRGTFEATPCGEGLAASSLRVERVLLAFSFRPTEQEPKRHRVLLKSAPCSGASTIHRCLMRQPSSSNTLCCTKQETRQGACIL